MARKETIRSVQLTVHALTTLPHCNLILKVCTLVALPADRVLRKVQRTELRQDCKLPTRDSITDTS